MRCHKLRPVLFSTKIKSVILTQATWAGGDWGPKESRQAVTVAAELLLPDQHWHVFSELLWNITVPHSVSSALNVLTSDINARWVLLKTASNRMGLIRLGFCQFSNLRMEIKRRPFGKMSLTPEDESVFHPSEHQSGMTVCPCVCVRVWGGHDPFQRKIPSERAWRKVSSIKPGLDLSPLCLCLSDGF